MTNLKTVKPSWPVRLAAKLPLLQFRNLIAPERCIGCLRENSWLCVTCRKMAGLKFRQWQNEKHPPTPASLTGLVSAGAYRTPMLRRGISWLKFKSVRPVATVLAELMVPALEQIRPLEQLRKGAVLTPLPLHPQRLAQRGFNQAEALVAELNQLTDIPQIHLLTRQRSTFKQTKLPSRLRKQNVSNAFSATLVTDDQHPVIIIIDDVSTTGSTLAEAARTLREAGVSSQIYGATIARG